MKSIEKEFRALLRKHKKLPYIDIHDGIKKGRRYYEVTLLIEEKSPDGIHVDRGSR